MTTYLTNAAGHKFYLEQAMDFSDDGRMTPGRGWFAGLVKGMAELSGEWFETKQAALIAIGEYRG